jgi:hypothetical protein
MPGLTSYDSLRSDYFDKIICKWEFENGTNYEDTYNEAINSCFKLGYLDVLWSLESLRFHSITDQDTLRYYIASSSFEGF